MRAVVTALGCSSVLLLAQSTGTAAGVELVNTVVGIGGRGDPTGARIPDKLAGTVLPTTGDYRYVPIRYPATVALDRSRDVALPLLHEYLTATGRDDAHLIVAAYSLGTMAAEQEKRNLQSLDPSAAPPRDQLTFAMIGSPFAGNGGIFARFPGVGIPGVTAGMGAAQPSRYDTTHYANMYDTYADFPAYFNPVALLNAALSIRYGHSDAAYDQIDPHTTPAYVTEVSNPTTGSTDRYVLFVNPRLPLLGPLRELAAMTGTSGLVEPWIGAVEPLLRVVVDMGYTDRVNANPTASVPFSVLTPLPKIAEALAALPGALAQGAANFTGGGHPGTTPPDPLGNLTTVPSVASAVAPVQRASSARDAEPESTPEVVSHDAAPADGLHPAVTSDGNKFTPGSPEPTPAAATGQTSPPSTPSTADPDTPTVPDAAGPDANASAPQPTSGQSPTSADAAA